MIHQQVAITSLSTLVTAVMGVTFARMVTSGITAKGFGQVLAASGLPGMGPV